MNEKLTKIAEKVSDYNHVKYGRLFIPEQVFAEYVLYYEGIDFEIDSKVMYRLIDDFYMEESASSCEIPMHAINFENLTTEEKEYFYQQLSDISKKIYDETDNEWLKGKLKNWFHVDC